MSKIYLGVTAPWLSLAFLNPDIVRYCGGSSCAALPVLEGVCTDPDCQETDVKTLDVVSVVIYIQPMVLICVHVHLLKAFV